ncbi:putative E3 ubiquitin-protein ligase LIN [Camellia lanceoleosa]|uniref:E3 ubiquitin-protein ligase LIN n=1 Tax=Camellia lanceoleosa TaxID=1840588 RepID=A0ACC0GUS4_9ERIC|nr:putative E3 ubiquitin-protein ligase LIN [Camellia lanceoleosa]
MPSDEELNGNFENIDEESSCSSIPRDFICPLTGLLFEDPVTLETGQTFERATVTEWFNQGYRTCPVTEKTLESQSMPHTNFILKRVIDSWKSERCRHLLAFACQQEREHRPKLEDERAVFILQHLLTSFSKEERITNAKLLMSLGGLQFLVRSVAADRTNMPGQKKLKERENEAIEDGSGPLFDEQLSIEVFGRKSGYISGLGRGPKPSTTASGRRTRAALEIENEETKRELEEQRRINEELNAKVHNWESNSVEVNAKIDLVMQQISRGGFTSDLPS